MISEIESLFLRTISELETKTFDGDEYNTLETSSLLRKLLLDATPLIDKVNHKYKEKIYFEVGESLGKRSKNPFHPILHAINDELDPDTSSSKKRRKLIRDQFLKTIVVAIREKTYSVREIILFEANVKGGVHFGEPKTKEEKLIEEANQIIFFELHRVSLRQLKPISRIVLKALKPLKDKILHNGVIATSNSGLCNEFITSYDKKLGINSDKADAYSNQAVTIGEVKIYNDPIVSPENCAGWFNRAIVLADLRLYEEAIGSYDEILKINPNDPAVWNNRGVILDRIGHHEEALFNYNKSLEFSSESCKVYYNIACCYALQNNVELALKNLEKAISLNPKLREIAKTDLDFQSIQEDEKFRAML